MENPNLRLLSRAQRRALMNGAHCGKKVKDFGSLLKDEIEKIEKDEPSFEMELRRQLKELEKIDPVDAHKMKRELGLSTRYYSRGDGWYV